MYMNKSGVLYAVYWLYLYKLLFIYYLFIYYLYVISETRVKIKRSLKILMKFREG